ncbi:MAG: hypothetical protein R6X02_07870 [Enhygromyxa sp.]
MAAKKRKTSTAKPTRDAKADEPTLPTLPTLAELSALGLDSARYEALPEDARALVGRAVVAALPVLQEDPSQLAGQLWGRLADLEQPRLRAFLQELREAAHGVLMPLTRSLPSPDSPLMRELAGHSELVKVLRGLPKGRLLSAAEDGTLRLWDLARGSSRVLRGHPGPINAIAISPDETLFATGSDNAAIVLWSVKGYKKLAVLKGHARAVRELGFTPDGARLVSASDDGCMRVWEIPGGESRVVAQYSQGITAMAVSPVAPLAAVATMDNSLRLVELDGGPERILYDSTHNFIGTVAGAGLNAPNQSGLGHDDFAKTLAFSPDGETLYSGQESLIAWEVKTGDQRERLRGHSWPIEDLACSGDGRIASAAESVVLWERGGSKAPSRLCGHPEGAHAVVFEPGDDTLFVGYEDGAIKQWDLSRSAARAGAPGHLRNVWSLALCPDQATLASGGADKSVILWELDSGRELGRFEGFEEVFVHALAWSADGGRLCASSGKDLLEWDAASGALIGIRRWTGRPFSARMIAPLPDARVLVAGWGAGLLCWPAQGEPSFLSGYRSERYTTALAISADGQSAFHAVQEDPPGKVRCWDLARGEIIRELETPGESMKELVLSDSGRFLVGGGSTGGVYVWDASSGALLHQLERHPYWVSHLLALPGDRVLSGADQGPVCEWELEGGGLRRRLASLEHLNHLCVSHDGARLAACRKQSVTLFDLERDAPLASFRASGPVDHLRISGDGQTVIAGERAGAVSILRYVP